MEGVMEVESKTSETRNEIKAYNMSFYATVCHVCKQFGDGVRLQRCSGCRMISYCGQQHQKEHWKQHKPLCKAMQDIKNQGLILDNTDASKMQLIVLVSHKLQRKLEIYEEQMIKFPRECVVCHEKDSYLLTDCQQCALVSFCRNHKDDVKHKHTCDALKLGFVSDVTILNGSSEILNTAYLKHVLNTDAFQNIKDFVKAYGSIYASSEFMRDVLIAQHSQFLTRPLTVFHAMQLLNYIPENETLIIHVINANPVDEISLVVWEMLLHLIGTLKSLMVVMVGPRLTHKQGYYFVSVCDTCMSQGKKFSAEFYSTLYEYYVRHQFFVKPDLIVGFNARIASHDLTVNEMWTLSIQSLAEQNCPFVYTTFMQQDLQDGIDRINIILDKKIDYFYTGKNPFNCLIPYRFLGPEQPIYLNNYLIVYKSLYS